jgi:hypothetical protein
VMFREQGLAKCSYSGRELQRVREKTYRARDKTIIKKNHE